MNTNKKKKLGTLLLAAANVTQKEMKRFRISSAIFLIKRSPLHSVFFFFLLFISPINLSISKSEKQMVYRRCKNRVPLDLYRFNDGAILCSQSVGKSNSRLPSDVNV